MGRHRFTHPSPRSLSAGQGVVVVLLGGVWTGDDVRHRGAATAIGGQRVPRGAEIGGFFSVAERAEDQILLFAIERTERGDCYQGVGHADPGVARFDDLGAVVADAAPDSLRTGHSRPARSLSAVLAARNRVVIDQLDVMGSVTDESSANQALHTAIPRHGSAHGATKPQRPCNSSRQCQRDRRAVLTSSCYPAFVS